MKELIRLHCDVSSIEILVEQPDVSMTFQARMRKLLSKRTFKVGREIGAEKWRLRFERWVEPSILYLDCECVK